jgi:CheY-like chemotaxis protein
MAHEDDEEGLFGLEGRRLLLVEDNRDCAEAMRRWLEICGAQVTTAATVTSALARTRSEAPDVMLVDVHLPDGTAWDVVERVRATVPAARGVPIVAVTGAPSPAVERFARAHGVRRVIAKPIAPAVLGAVLAECLAVGPVP